MVPLLGLICSDGLSAIGIAVDSVTSDSPAALCGLREGDLIAEAMGTPTKSKQDFDEIMAGVRPGDTASMLVVRNGQVDRGVKGCCPYTWGF